MEESELTEEKETQKQKSQHVYFSCTTQLLMNTKCSRLISALKKPS